MSDIVEDNGGHGVVATTICILGGWVCSEKYCEVNYGEARKWPLNDRIRA